MVGRRKREIMKRVRSEKGAIGVERHERGGVMRRC